jgi:dipeptidyl aminopeptidase/acylaminoacyl peptidase
LKKLIFTAAFAILAVHAVAQTRHFSPDDLTKIVRVSDPQIAPDGKTIAFVVGRANLKEDRWDSEIDLVDVSKHTLRVMTHGRMGAGSPRWSPAGDRLAFIAPDADKKAQIFVLSMDGGDALEVTKSKTSVASFSWSPDGAQFAYAAADEEPEKKDEAKFEDWFEVGNNDVYQKSRLMPVHLWTIAASGGDAKRVTSGSWSMPNHFPGSSPSLVWTKDGASVIIERAETPLTGDSATGRLEVVDAKTGAMKPLTGATIEEGGPMLSPDGTRVLYTTARDGKHAYDSSVYVAPVTGGASKDAAYALDRSISGAEWMPDSNGLLVGATDHTRPTLWLQPIGGNATKLELGDLSPSAQVNVAKDGGIAFTATTPDRPAELFYLAKIGDAPVQLTHLQTVTDGVELGKSETVHWKNDGFDESGVLTYPPAYTPGKKLAMILYIHGGPKAASVQTFSPVAQILAAQGWLVFEPNYRGSNSDGNAYESAIIHDAGVGPGKDVMAGVKTLEARGIVDEKRIGVSGWSYGGYMTSWLIGNYPDTWVAALAGAPVTDLTDEYSESDVGWLSQDIFGPDPYTGDNLKLYVAESPITYAHQMKAPTLILSDTGDYRVPPSQAYKLYHALKGNGVTVKFIAYPVVGHSPADPIRSRDVWREWVTWFTPYLSPK